jgi:hypothetical protein
MTTPVGRMQAQLPMDIVGMMTAAWVFYAMDPPDSLNELDLSACIAIFMTADHCSGFFMCFSSPWLLGAATNPVEYADEGRRSLKDLREASRRFVSA